MSLVGYKWLYMIRPLVKQKVDFDKEGANDYDVNNLPTVRETSSSLEETNCVTSKFGGFYPSNRHKVLLDIDHPTFLFPSAREDHYHLYVDINVPWEDLIEFMDAGVKIGLLEPGFVNAAKTRGYTTLRYPWIKKEVNP